MVGRGREAFRQESCSRLMLMRWKLARKTNLWAKKAWFGFHRHSILPSLRLHCYLQRPSGHQKGRLAAVAVMGMAIVDGDDGGIVVVVVAAAAGEVVAVAGELVDDEGRFRPLQRQDMMDGRTEMHGYHCLIDGVV